jgi:uncharacterized protein (DUF305 family)
MKGAGVQTRASLTIGVAALALLVTVAACSNDQASNSKPSATTSASASATHNDADVTFAQNMIPHHEQAIAMSDIILAKQGVDPRVMQLAGQIKAAQDPEIRTMQGWLTQWGKPSAPTASSGMPGMRGHDMSGTGSMPGMMSEDDMTALRNAQGVDASRLFLQQMIRHHEGAISMAQQEVNSGKYPDAVAMARTIATSQQQEVNTMNGILASM